MHASTAQSATTSFSWVGAYYAATTPGASAVLPQADPTLATPAVPVIVAEITVQSAGQQQVVEVGWTVDGAQGDLLPHLFVFAWVNGKGLGYDCCGYVQTGRTWAPGDHVKPGISAQYGIMQQGGKWWISYQGHRIGYYPNSLWHGRFTSGKVSQAFGEVASNGRAGTQMINGRTDRKSRTSTWSALGPLRRSSTRRSHTPPTAWAGTAADGSISAGNEQPRELAGDQDRTAQRYPGQYSQRGHRNPYAPVTYRVAEYGRVRPAVQADRAGPAAKGAQGVGVQAKRQYQRTVGRVARRQRSKQKSTPGRRGRAPGAHGHGPRSQLAPSVKYGQPECAKVDLDPIGAVGRLQSAAPEVEPPGRAVRPGRQQDPVPPRLRLHYRNPGRAP